MERSRLWSAWISERGDVDGDKSTVSGIDCVGRGGHRSIRRRRPKPGPRSRFRWPTIAGAGDAVCPHPPAATQGSAPPRSSESSARRSGQGSWSRSGVPRESRRPWRPGEDRHRRVQAARTALRHRTRPGRGRNRRGNRGSRGKSGSNGVFQTGRSRGDADIHPRQVAVESGWFPCFALPEGWTRSVAGSSCSLFPHDRSSSSGVDPFRVGRTRHRSAHQ